jgi:hypothetical protein
MSVPNFVFSLDDTVEVSPTLVAEQAPAKGPSSRRVPKQGAPRARTKQPASSHASPHATDETLPNDSRGGEPSGRVIADESGPPSVHPNGTKSRVATVETTDKSKPSSKQVQETQRKVTEILGAAVKMHTL